MPEGLPTPKIPSIEVSNQGLNTPFKPVIYIAQIRDQRLSSALIKELDGKEKSTTGDLGLVLHYAVRKLFRTSGFDVSDKAPVTLAIKIEKWLATKSDKQIVFEASLIADIVGPSGDSIYSSTYDSFSTSPNVSLSDEQIVARLETTMAEALSELIDDKQLVTILSSY